MGAVGGLIAAMPTPGQAIGGVFRGIQWGLDRMVSVGYGVMYDCIVARFRPYQELHGEVLRLLESAVAPGANRREIRVLDVACGPGNFTLGVAAAGFDTVGIDAYAGLVDLAREKRKAHHLANLAFRHADLTRGGTFPDASFDQVVNIHSLYVQPDPQQMLREVYRVLKPGGHAVIVNFTRRVWLRSTVREVRRREGLGAALRCLLWVLPNSVFEATRKRVRPQYWGETEFAAHLKEAGFRVLELRRTFFEGASLLAWVSKEDGE
jgi:demethylmenaquinone methyltransferase / 2-methoxy-6-polyprenyl-1,4-benzoquinol methylase